MVLLLAGLTWALLSMACSDEVSLIEGEEGEVCYPNSTCNTGLVCTQGTCTRITTRGYALFGSDKTSYLVDTNSTVVHTWQHTTAGASMPFLMDDGTLLRPGKAPVGSLEGGGAGGLLERVAWDGTVLWSWTYSSDTVRQHHDIQPMPNGNVLFIAWEKKTKQQALAAGRADGPDEIWPLHIVEVKPDGKSGGVIVWKWHAWDHLVQEKDATKANYGKVSEHPELLDVNFGYVKSGDWIHANHIDYDPKRDEIIFSSHLFHEVFIIDHSTTTAQAAGHTGGKKGKGGDILYRWGNPQVHGAGAAADQHLFVVHGANFIDEGLPGAGNILLFNNGDRTGTDKDDSSVEEITPPRDAAGNFILSSKSVPYGPAKAEWTYSDPGNFYSAHLAGAYRIKSGNTLITDSGKQRLLEVTRAGKIVWEYTAPSRVIRSNWCEPDHPGLTKLKQ